MGGVSKHSINVAPTASAKPGRAELRAVARRSIAGLSEALAELSNDLPDGLFDAISVIISAAPGVIVSGIGKSGIAARKMAATMCSTGTPAFFLHAADAAHGDIGMMPMNGCAILVSWSGETDEILSTISTIKERQGRVIAITGCGSSELARRSDVVINCQTRPDKDGDRFVPTTSTGILMAMGDALAQMLRLAQGITMVEIAGLHPAGAVGKQMSRRVGDIMHTDRLPQCPPGASITEVTAEITRGGLGAVLIMEGQRLIGIVTDGDVRRGAQRIIHPTAACEIMSPNPYTIGPGDLMPDAVDRMHRVRITVLAVTEGDSVVGMLSIHD